MEYDFPKSLAERYDGLEEYMSYPNEVIRVIAENRGVELNIIELYKKHLWMINKWILFGLSVKYFWNYTDNWYNSRDEI